jgi:hypothetical protein
MSSECCAPSINFTMTGPITSSGAKCGSMDMAGAIAGWVAASIGAIAGATAVVGIFENDSRQHPCHVRGFGHGQQLCGPCSGCLDFAKAEAGCCMHMLGEVENVRQNRRHAQQC